MITKTSNKIVENHNKWRRETMCQKKALMVGAKS